MSFSTVMSAAIEGLHVELVHVETESTHIGTSKTAIFKLYI